MTILLALACIIIGFVVAIVGGHFLFPPLVWFVAAIAFNTLGDVLALIPGRRNPNA